MGLRALSRRCTQPIQQQGRRFPSISSKQVRRTCSRRVDSRLTDSTQQIHSLRASGVVSSHIKSAFVSAISASFKSGGTACTVPPEILFMSIACISLVTQVRDAGIEPASQPWEGRILPLNQSRFNTPYNERFRHYNELFPKSPPRRFAQHSSILCCGGSIILHDKYHSLSRFCVR